MSNEFANTLRILSEDIVDTVSKRVIEEAVVSLKNIPTGCVNERRGDFRNELTSYVQTAISAELGRILARMEAEKSTDDVKQVFTENIRNIPLVEMEFSVSAQKAFKNLGYMKLGDLLDLDPVDLIDTKGFGNTNRIYLTNFLKQRGIEWSEDLTLEKLRERRCKRLDAIPLKELFRCDGYVKSDRWEVKALSDREFRDYIIDRVSKLSDEELYPYGLNSFVRLFSRTAVLTLEDVGVRTFGDLLSLSLQDLIEKMKKFRTADAVIANVIAGLALIGRRLK